MKVLQIIDSLATGGAEKLLLDSIPLYKERGVNMDLLVLQDKDYPFMQALESIDCCKIYKLGVGSVYNPLLVFKISKILKHYDIAHVHLFPAQYWAVLAKNFSRAKTKLIFTEHSTSNKRMRYRFSKSLEFFFYNQYDLIVAITSRIREIMISYIPSIKEKVVVVQNGILLSILNDVSPYSKEDLGFDANDVLLIQVSSMQYPKDHKTLINSMAELPTYFKLILVGDGVLKKELINMVNTKGLGERVIFFGRRDDVPKLLKSVDLVILSSIYEGLSLSSIEGMASGKPFLATNVPGLSEIVDGGGLLFEQGNSQELSSLIMTLMNDKVLYNKTSNAGIKRAKEYDISNMVDQYISHYEKIIEK